MALPINIEQLISGKVVEWERLDFKQGWNPEDVLHTTCAFANDIHNWGGGYIVVGVEEKDGTPVLPPCGVDLRKVDGMQKELVHLCNLIQPVVNVLSEPVEVMGKMVLIIWVPGGEIRPYKAPLHLGNERLKQGKVYYVRQGSVTRQANQEEEQVLMRLCNKVPFDDRICQQASLDDLSLFYIRDFLQRSGRSITDEEVMGMPRETLFWNLQIVGGTSEYLKPKNVGLLFFSDNAEKYIPYARIEIVRFLDDVGDRFEEKILHGPIYLQLKEALDYIKSQVVVEKVIKVHNQAEAIRVYNYPYDALEEILCNAVFHKTWEDRNPIEVRINPSSIEVFNIEGPMPPLTQADMLKERVASRNYRNRRIGDFLKELKFTEGRSTGFPKIRRALRINGSPEVRFETDERNTFFLAHLDIHPAFVADQVVVPVKEQDKEFTQTVIKGQEVSVVLIDVLKDVQKDIIERLSDRQKIILETICLFPEKTLAEMSTKLKVSPKTIQREFIAIRKLGINIVREGGRKNGRWIIDKNSTAQKGCTSRV